MPSGTTNGAVGDGQQRADRRQVEVVVVVVGDQHGVDRRQLVQRHRHRVQPGRAEQRGRRDPVAPHRVDAARAARRPRASALAWPNQVTASSAASAGSSGVRQRDRATGQARRAAPRASAAAGPCGRWRASAPGSAAVVEAAVGELRRAGDGRPQLARVAPSAVGRPQAARASQATGPARTAAVEGGAAERGRRHPPTIHGGAAHPRLRIRHAHVPHIARRRQGAGVRADEEPRGRRGRRPGLLAAPGLPRVRTAGRRGPADPLPGVRRRRSPPTERHAGAPGPPSRSRTAPDAAPPRAGRRARAARRARPAAVPRSPGRPSGRGPPPAPGGWNATSSATTAGGGSGCP